jgi:MSHA biogenesis protein MshL
MKKTILVALLGSILAGCATPHLTYNGMVDTTQARTAELVQATVAKPAKPAGVREIDAPYVDFKRVEATRKRGDVSIKAAATPFAPLMAEVAKRAGFSVVFADNVDTNKKITAEFNNAVAEDVLRNTAFLAGYAAVIDRDRRMVTVADTATYTFKLPAGVFNTLQASYQVGGSASSSGGSGGGGGSSGGSGGGSGGGASLQAQFTVAGKEGTTATSVQKLIKDVAGGNAEVTVSEMGFLSVRANAQSLRRVHEFLKKIANDAMTQVDMEASVIEVGLTKEFQMGIQWGKVIQTASGTAGLSSNAATNIGKIAGDLQNGGTPGDAVNALIGASASSGVGAFRLGASSASIIQALSTFSDVKVVSQPRLFSMNNTPATFFDGTQIPYLGSVQQTAASTAGGAPTVSGSTSFAIDGISFSVVPSVVDKERVQITLIPVLSTVGAFEKFQLGVGSALTVPRQANKQTYMRVLAESGKTLVIGGIRSGLDTKDTSVGASTGTRSTTKEVVILLRANVIAAPEYDPVVAESI